MVQPNYKIKTHSLVTLCARDSFAFIHPSFFGGEGNLGELTDSLGQSKVSLFVQHLLNTVAVQSALPTLSQTNAFKFVTAMEAEMNK